MSIQPFLIGESGITIGTAANTGNIIFDIANNNVYIGISNTSIGNLIINSNISNANSNSYAISVAGGMSVGGNLYVNGTFGLHGTMSNAATIGVGDIFYAAGGIANAQTGGITTVPASNLYVGNNVSNGGAARYTQVPSGTYKCIGPLQSVQTRGLMLRIS
jgi:hypothetical protein